MKDLYDSIVRTLVPIIVGGIIGVLVTRGIPLDSDFESTLTLAIMGGFQAIYYVAARWLETHVSPRFGWLLGSTKQPDYFKRVKVTENGETFQVRTD